MSEAVAPTRPAMSYDGAEQLYASMLCIKYIMFMNRALYVDRLPCS